MFGEISILDWSMLAFSIVSAAFAYIRGLHRLQPGARKWLGEIGEPTIRAIINESAQMIGLTPLQRRERAVELLREAVKKSLGLDIPTSIANYLVEHVYQSIKERAAK